jgi:hypothetical protein
VTVPENDMDPAGAISAGSAADATGTEPAGRAGPARRAWAAWRRWRRTRPFWGGLLVILAGLEILLTVRTPLRVLIHVGPQGLAGYLVPTVMVLCGLLLWFTPAQRLFYSVVAVLMALTSWVTSNLGGFLVGLLLGLVGGSLAFAWAPGPRRSRARLRRAPG